MKNREWTKPAGDDTPLTPFGEAVAAGDGTLHGAITYWQDRALKAEADAFQMAAGQCCVKSGGLMADDHGKQYCDMERQRDELKAVADLTEEVIERQDKDIATLKGEAAVLADILRDAYEVIKTIEGENSDEQERLRDLCIRLVWAIQPEQREKIAD